MNIRRKLNGFSEREAALLLGWKIEKWWVCANINRIRQIFHHRNWNFSFNSALSLPHHFIVHSMKLQIFGICTPLVWYFQFGQMYVAKKWKRSTVVENHWNCLLSFSYQVPTFQINHATSSNFDNFQFLNTKLNFWTICVDSETFEMIFNQCEEEALSLKLNFKFLSRFSTWYVNVLTIHLSEIKVHLLLFPSFHGLIWKVLGMENRESEAQGEKAEQLWSYSRAKVFAFSNFSHDSSRRPAALQTTAGELRRDQML